MKYTLAILVTLTIIFSKAIAADEPQAFDKFYKKTMTVVPGTFPIYQDGSKYFIELPIAALNRDVLVIGDVSGAFQNGIANSSGIINFSLGNGNNLNVTKAIYKETASADFNEGFETVIQKSNLIPISFIMPIVAYGKDKKSYILDLTKQLTEDGDLFSFREISDVANPDASRSGVQKVKSSDDGVVFTVLRTKTKPGSTVNGRKFQDKAVAYELNLVIQYLPSSQMEVREASQRVGFATISYNDFGKSKYGVRSVQGITKWNLKVAPADLKKYQAGELVNPVKAINVYIDPATPAIFKTAIQKAVAQWNVAFQNAGFKNALILSVKQQGDWLSAGKILINWSSAAATVATNLMTDPRTGEILAGKMIIGDEVVNNLLPAYFARCGMQDLRIQKDLYDPEVRSEIMTWKVAQNFGQLLGMVPNLYGSVAYSPDQLRSGSWIKKNGITSSVTDNVEFNYVVQPGDKVAVADLIPRVGAYDYMAIGWAYRLFKDRVAEKKALPKASNENLMFLEENKNDPFTQNGDLSSNQIEASLLGMKNIQLFYPQVEKISAAMKGDDENWSKFKLISAAFQNNYQLYSDNVSSYIGGQSNRVVAKNYNEIPVVYVSKTDQQKTMALLNDWFFTGTPLWMQNKRLNLLNSESEDLKMLRSAQLMLKKLISPVVLNNMIKAEYAQGKDAYRVSEFFDELDHYVFKDFNTTEPISAYTRSLQNNFILDLASAAAKTNITAGLSDVSEVLHQYHVRTMARLNSLSQEHQDPQTKAFYQQIMQTIKRDLNQK